MPTLNHFLFIAALNGFLAVALGAFGSHGLKSRLTEHYLSVWQTAVQYHFYHAIALCVVAFFWQVLFWQKLPNTLWLNFAGWLFLAGIFLFCGSLYWLALGGPTWLGPVTPLGGLCFLAAWLALSVSALRIL